MAIDALAHSRDMERVGFAPKQARGMAEAFDKALSTAPVVTRNYRRAELAKLRTALRAEMAGLRAAPRGEIGGLRTELHGEIGGLRAEIIKDQGEPAWKMAGVLLVQAGAIVAPLKLLPRAATAFPRPARDSWSRWGPPRSVLSGCE